MQSNKALTSTSIRTVDTDVVVLAISSAGRLNVPVWIVYGTGKHTHIIPAHEIAASIGPSQSVALPMFHAFTGCDIVSFFAGRGKKSAWEVWKAYKPVTDIFCKLIENPASRVIEEMMHVLERFVILLYDRTSEQVSINFARKELFTKKGRQIESIPPIKAALYQHIKRAVFQAGHIWAQAVIPQPEIPSPADWGWTLSETGKWDVCWTTLPEASSACRELLKCGCKKGCKKNCTCVKAMLQCTALCYCGGQCGAEFD